jgi:PTS system nitrogen regulatory IIA component
MRLEQYLHPDRTLVLEGVSDPDELLIQLARAAGSAGVDTDELEASLRDRESRAPTSTPEGVAFPHALLETVDETVVIAALAPDGVRLGKADHPPSDVIFCMVGSARAPWDHVRLLARLARIARGAGALERIRQSKNGQELYEALVREDRAHG